MKRIRSRPTIAGGIALIGAVALILISNWDPIASGHPSYLVLYIGSLALGTWLVWRGLSSALDTARPLRSGFATAGVIVLLAAAFWLSPFGANQVALDALDDADGITVTETATRIFLEPGQEASTTGLIFHPGARVDARSYARTLVPLAEAGHRVVIIKAPLGIAFLSIGSADSEVSNTPGIERWAVGGHSLGGVAASADAESAAIDGLLLWASYPASDISTKGTLGVSSIYGTNDGLSTPDRVEASANDLPPSTTFIRIEGAIHAHFGDYGVQPGDGKPGTDRDSAQSAIAEASVDLLELIESR